MDTIRPDSIQMPTKLINVEPIFLIRRGANVLMDNEFSTMAATTGIGLHFAMGGIILILGSIQLIDTIRLRFSDLHRWPGRPA